MLDEYLRSRNVKETSKEFLQFMLEQLQGKNIKVYEMKGSDTRHFNKTDILGIVRDEVTIEGFLSKLDVWSACFFEPREYYYYWFNKYQLNLAVIQVDRDESYGDDMWQVLPAEGWEGVY